MDDQCYKTSGSRPILEVVGASQRLPVKHEHVDTGKTRSQSMQVLLDAQKLQVLVQF